MFSFLTNKPEKRKKEFIKWARINKIENIREDTDIENITRLHISNKRIDRLPREIDLLAKLEVLDLSHNSLAELPFELKHLKNLRHLYLSFNQLKEFQDVLFELSSLEVLNMEGNMLKKIPEKIIKLSQLRELNLMGNQIINLPQNFGSLSHLTKLNLAINQLTDLPESFSQLTQIQTLELWLNKFDTIPEVIKNLPNLKDFTNVVDPERLNKTLIWAVINDNTRLVDKLIYHGADVNYKDTSVDNQIFTTPLFEAKSLDMITLLLTMGADPFLEREIVKYVKTRNGVEMKRTGMFESFINRQHPKEIEKFKKSYLETLEIVKKSKNN